MSRTRVLLAVVITALGAAALVGAAGTAGAAINPCGTSGNYFDGGIVTGVSQYGVTSDIGTYEADLCGSSSTSSAWVGEQNSANAGIVQIGYVHAGSTSGFGGEAWTVFDQKQKCTYCTINITFFNTTPSGTKTYKVGYDSTNHRFNLWYDGSQLDYTSWDPIVEWAWPWQGAFTGETWHCNTDVPGTSGNPVTFSNIKKKASDETWSYINDLGLFNPSCGGGSSRYQRSWVSDPDSFKIYTDPLS